MKKRHEPGDRMKTFEQSNRNAPAETAEAAEHAELAEAPEPTKPAELAEVPEPIKPAETAESPETRPAASAALVELASESWRFHQVISKSLQSMDPFDAQRLSNHYAWYERIVQDVLDEADLHVVDLTGEPYDVGMAVTPLNLEDFPNDPRASYHIAQMVEPIVMQGGVVRKHGTAMLGENLESR